MNTTRRCYACDAQASGHAMHGGEIKPSCRRHADPGLSICLCTAKVHPHQGRIVGYGPYDGAVMHKQCFKQLQSY